ncbi:MAG: hypothetical protein LBT00_09920 [Spirochaetaceae bacterium]|nr:hypothetical protein [Spirochaetaceae bacterium]
MTRIGKLLVLLVSLAVAGGGNMARFTIIAPSIDTTCIDGTTIEWTRWGSVPPAQ